MTASTDVLDPALVPLVDRYLALTGDLKHLEAEREEVRDRLLAAVRHVPGAYRGAGGAVLVQPRPTARFDPPRVVAALARADLLVDLASVDARRLRGAFDGRADVRAAVARLVEPVDATVVVAAPPRLPTLTRGAGTRTR